MCRKPFFLLKIKFLLRRAGFGRRQAFISKRVLGQARRSGGLAAKDFFDQLDELEFQGLWIVAEGPHLADDGAIEVLFETQDPIRTIKDALDTQEIIKGNLQIEGLAHGIFL